jgi:tRNA nucleotidyltransferase (CCA-adding enzyme)
MVGGCVRDYIMGRIPFDWDITTSAKPEEVKALFDRTYDTGIEHGTVTILMNQQSFEVTTYRIEGEYKDFRRPTEVFFTKEITKDLSRRDFTMNAIAYHPQEGFVDPFDGRKDIKAGIIRCVRNPQERFTEDALRILRALRFSAQLNFEIEKQTIEAIKQCGPLIGHVSSERIREELNKLLLSDHVMKFLLMEELDILTYILPEFKKCLKTVQNNPHHVYNVGIHALKSVEAVDKSLFLRWTMLLHDIAKPLCKTTDDQGIDHFHGHGKKGEQLAKTILKRLKFDNETIRKVSILILWHDTRIDLQSKSVRRVLYQLGEELFLSLLKVQEADIKAQSPQFYQMKQEKLDKVTKIYQHIKQNNDCFSKKDLAVNGKDLMDLGMTQGKQVGVLLEELMNAVLEDPRLNEKEKLLLLAQKKMQD